MKFLWKLISAKPMVTIAIVVITTLLGQLAFAEHKIRVLNIEADSLSLHALNLEAAADTSRELILDLHDLRNTYSRLVIQRRIERDSIDDLLELESKARLTLAARVDSLSLSATTHATRDSADVRFASWTGIYKIPYTVNVNVRLPLPPTPGTITVGIVMDPADITLRLTCMERPGRVDAAEVVVRGPEWLNLNIGEVEQDPLICNERLMLVDGGPSWFRDTVLGVATGALVGLLLDDLLKGAIVGGGVGLSWHIAF